MIIASLSQNIEIYFRVLLDKDIIQHVLAFLSFHVVTSEGWYLYALSGLFKLELRNKSVIIYETDLLYKQHLYTMCIKPIEDFIEFIEIVIHLLSRF